MNNCQFKLPKKDFPSVEGLLSDARTRPTNVGLIFYKYIPWSRGRNGEEKAKIDQFTSLLRRNSKRIPNERLPLSDYSSYFKRLESLLKRLGEQGYFVPNPALVAKLGWRLAINLGEESVYETSISFHRSYSVPIIRGSVVKGCARLASFYEVLRDKIPDGEVEQLKQIYRISEGESRKYLQCSESLGDAIEKLKVFGSQEVAGKVIFFDALPIIPNNDKCFIKLDVMNVHYQDYYRDTQGKEPPGDWIGPNPIYFPIVEGISYIFNVASKEKNLADMAIKYIKRGITVIGIGAKTSAGYGYFVLG